MNRVIIIILLISSINLQAQKFIGKNGKIKYLKYFNSNLVAEFIINKTLDLSNKKKYLWHDK